LNNKEKLVYIVRKKENSMKKTIVVFVFLAASLALFGEAPVASRLKPDQTYYVIEDLVNVRAEATTSSDILLQAEVGTSVKVLEVTDIVEVIMGFRANWYKVELMGSTGYLWGGLLGDRHIVIDIDNDGMSEIIMARGVLDYDHYMAGEGNPVYVVRLCHPGTMLNEDLLADYPEAKVFSDISAYPVRGFMQYMVFLSLKNYNGGYGAYMSHNTYYYFSEDWKLTRIIRLDSEGDEFENRSAVLHTPEDHGSFATLVALWSVSRKMKEVKYGGVVRQETYLWKTSGFELIDSGEYEVYLGPPLEEL
jgi:hypothetical protein